MIIRRGHSSVRSFKCQLRQAWFRASSNDMSAFVPLGFGVVGRRLFHGIVMICVGFVEVWLSFFQWRFSDVDDL